MAHNVRACPNCDSTDNYSRSDRYDTAVGEGEYKCKDCRHTFDDPVIRESKETTVVRTGTAGDLADMDPEEAF